MPHQSALNSTPQLARLLARLRARLVAQIWMHGLGLLLAVIGAWLAFVFFADWALHVPRVVRWFHLAVFVALPVFLTWRELFRHLGRVPDSRGLALLLERAHPQLRQILVSAVELQSKPVGAAHPELVERVLRDAELAAQRLDTRGVLSERPQQWRMAAGILAVAMVFAGVVTSRELSGIFFARLLGSDQPWPQRTHLELALAGPADAAQLRETSEGLEAKVARGTDVALVVTARGVVPEEVLLHFDGGNDVVLGSASDGTFRTLLRSCREDLTVFASGGDERATRRLRILVLDPPDIAGLAVRIEPPPYAGAAARVEFDRDVRVLAGSKLSIVALTRPADSTGQVRLLPADTLVRLEPRPFPQADGASEPAPIGLGFETVALQSLRYRFELRDGSGLSDPDPGLFSIDVQADDRPEVDLIAPARLDVETLASGALRLSARARDDFGIAAMTWRSRSVGQSTENSGWTPFELRPVALPLRGDEAQRGVAVVGSTRVDVASLAVAGAAPVDGDLFEIDVQALDTRPAAADGAPDPAGVGSCAALRVRIVGDDEFLRRIQDRLSKVRGQATELDELLRRQISRTRDALAVLEREAAGASDLAALSVGDRRALGDGEALTRELAGTLESVLYARLEEKSGALLEALDAQLAQASGKGFPLEAWRNLAEGLSSGRLNAQGLAGQLSGLFQLALAISADELPQAVAALERAAQRTEPEALHSELSAALESELSAQKSVAALLDRLAEWDNFQSILSLTRDILNRQKSVRDKTVEISTPSERK
ncbi:MAG: hypothetical protein IT454_02995 [Planctomycetes bacterium]|nr:hypothetical protein [Planctomycetota bacterium]